MPFVPFSGLNLYFWPDEGAYKLSRDERKYFGPFMKLETRRVTYEVEEDKIVVVSELFLQNAQVFAQALEEAVAFYGFRSYFRG